MLQKLYLNHVGMSYILDELSQGAELSQRLCWLELQKGAAFTYVPTELSLSSLSNFSESMEFLSGRNVIHDFDEITVQLIAKYLSKNIDNVVMFETLWRANDPIISKRNYKMVIINSSVYYFISGNDEPKPIIEYLQYAKNYPTVIVLSKRILDENYLPKSKNDTEALELFYESIDYIIVGAFDGEGFIFWSKYRDT